MADTEAQAETNTDSVATPNDMLRDTAGKAGREVIYLPTEAGMPVLEATRNQERLRAPE